MRHPLVLLGIVLLTFANLTTSARAQVRLLSTETLKITLEDGKDIKEGYTFTVDVQVNSSGTTSRSYYQKDGGQRTEQPDQAATFHLHWTGLFYSWESAQGGHGFTWWNQSKNCWTHEIHRENGKVLIRELHPM